MTAALESLGRLCGSQGFWPYISPESRIHPAKPWWISIYDRPLPQFFKGGPKTPLVVNNKTYETKQASFFTTEMLSTCVSKSWSPAASTCLPLPVDGACVLGFGYLRVKNPEEGLARNSPVRLGKRYIPPRSKQQEVPKTIPKITRKSSKTPRIKAIPEPNRELIENRWRFKRWTLGDYALQHISTR